jgi:hypothetical protein
VQVTACIWLGAFRLCIGVAEQPTTNNEQRTTNNEQQTTNNQQPATKQPTTNNQQPTTNNQQPTTNNQQPTTNNQQPTTNNEQPTPITAPFVTRAPGTMLSQCARSPVNVRVCERKTIKSKRRRSKRAAAGDSHRGDPVYI